VGGKDKIAGAGFINVSIARRAMSVVTRIAAERGDFGRGVERRGSNSGGLYRPTGPLHVGHGRQAALGDALANLWSWQGAAVTREFYHNDTGVQIHNLAISQAHAPRKFWVSMRHSPRRLSRRVHSRGGAALPR
jgi:arginyl-tRNA synthetase